MERSFILTCILSLALSSPVLADDAVSANGGNNGVHSGQGGPSVGKSDGGSASTTAPTSVGSRHAVINVVQWAPDVVAKLSGQNSSCQPAVSTVSTSNVAASEGSQGAEAPARSGSRKERGGSIIGVQEVHSPEESHSPRKGKDRMDGEKARSELAGQHRPHGYGRHSKGYAYHSRPLPQTAKSIGENPQGSYIRTTFESSDTDDYPSLDGTRMVKVDRVTKDAYLYDTSDEPRFAPLYLASDVESVEFTEEGSEDTLHVVLELQDGSFELFDGSGASYAMAKAANYEPIDDLSQR